MRTTILTCLLAMGALTTFTAVRLELSFRGARHAVLQGNQHTLDNAIKSFEQDQGHPLQSAKELVDAGYLESLPGRQSLTEY